MRRHWPALAQRLTDTADALLLDLVDGRLIAVPLKWYPRLVHATAAQRSEWRLIGRGDGIHWPAIDEEPASRT